jgi:hypothetical protein
VTRNKERRRSFEWPAPRGRGPLARGADKQVAVGSLAKDDGAQARPWATLCSLRCPVAHGPPRGGPKAMRAASWPGRWFRGVELHPRPHTARGVLLRFEWLRKPRGAQAFRSSSGRPGWLSYVRCSPGGGRRRSKTRPSSPKRTDRRANDGMHDLGGNAQSQAQAGVAASNHRPSITSDPYKPHKPLLGES